MVQGAQGSLDQPIPWTPVHGFMGGKPSIHPAVVRSAISILTAVFGMHLVKLGKSGVLILLLPPSKQRSLF